MTSPSRRLLLAAVRSMLASETGRPYGAGQAPSAVVQGEAYGIVHLWPGDGTWGSLGTYQDTFRVTVQVDSVGWTQEQSLWLSDKVMAAMLDPDLALAGAGGSPRVLRVVFQSTGGTEATGSLHSTPDRFDMEVAA